MAAPDSKQSSRPAPAAANAAPASASSQKKASSAKPATKQRGGRGRWLRRIFLWFPLTLVIVLVAAGPSLVSYTPLGRQLIARFAPVDGSVEVGSLSIGWFTPLAMSEIVARDPAGETLAEVAAVQGRQAAVGAG